MELHSYAKRRTTKKWSIEQKRQLVEARIAYDALFEHQPNNSVAPWKKVMSLAKLDDYNVFFVRRQWGNMIEKYKQYKQNRLGNTPSKAIDNEMLDKLKLEWEFFEPIHRFMTRKTTNLHSYALTSDPPVEFSHKLSSSIGANASLPETASNSSNEQIIAFSSDTNEDYAAAGLRNDHDFYSKKTSSASVSDKQKQYFADASEDTQESMLMELTTTAEETIEHEVMHTAVPAETDYKDQHEAYETKVFATLLQQLPEPEMAELTILQTQHIKTEPLDEQDVSMAHIDQSMPTTQNTTTTTTATNHNNQSTSSTGGNRTLKQLSERDKYYRHKRRFNRRLEVRFDAILNVFGQIVKAEYPNVDVTPLAAMQRNANSNGQAHVKNLTALNGLINHFSSSNDEETTDAEEVNGAC